MEKTFVQVGDHYINPASLAYVRKLEGHLRLYFNGPKHYEAGTGTLILNLGREDSEKMERWLETHAFAP